MADGRARRYVASEDGSLMTSSDVLFEHAALLAHPRPSTGDVDRRVRLELHSAARELGKDTTDIARILIRGQQSRVKAK